MGGWGELYPVFNFEFLEFSNFAKPLKNIYCMPICSMPLGLVAVYRATQCKDAIKKGDQHQATVRSRQAKRLSYWSMGFGALCIVASLIGAAVYVASAYRQELKLWMAGRYGEVTTIEAPDELRPTTRCCMQA